jgi:glycosyltransferase involved in cell wall biosynthesis
MQSGGLKTKNIHKHSQEDFPLITVVTVVYNGEGTLEETILSVINQTYKNIEYIIIDGASTDNTLDIIKKYEDKIDYWICEPDEGIFYAMNKGIDLSTGEWINFMNSGDYFYDIKTISNSIKYFVPSVTVVYGDTMYKFDFGLRLMVAPKRLPRNPKRMFFCHQSCFVKMELMKSRHFNVHYRIIADFDFFYFLYCNAFHFQYIPIIISTYECLNGVSATDPVTVKLEQSGILGYNGKWWFKLYFVFIKVYFKIKNSIKRLLPVKMLTLYRKFYMAFRGMRW